MKPLVVFSLLCLFLSGCGYNLGEIRPTTMRSVRSLAVPSFKNQTYEPRLEAVMADTVIKELQNDGTYTILNSSEADAILHCTLAKAERRAVRSVLTDVLATREFDLVLVVDYKVEDRVTGIILMEGEVQGRASFFSSPDLQTDERQAFPVATHRMAVDLVSRLAEGW